MEEKEESIFPQSRDTCPICGETETLENIATQEMIAKGRPVPVVDIPGRRAMLPLINPQMVITTLPMLREILVTCPKCLIVYVRKAEIIDAPVTFTKAGQPFQGN